MAKDLTLTIKSKVDRRIGWPGMFHVLFRSNNHLVGVDRLGGYVGLHEAGDPSFQFYSLYAGLTCPSPLTLFVLRVSRMRDVPSGSPAAGLEVDSRPVDQSEKIANGGHMTPAHEGPVPSYSEPTAWHPASTAPFAGSDYSENKVPTQKSNRAGLGGAVLWLSVALAIALILAVVAAGVGGSLAASRKEKLSRYARGSS